ncbi:hypothetical protein GCM10008018_14710 [Paenibacillus marchantiophytorum]|uniref:Uncharacterized protein n=1 Tax=Paenibacillus marchantiophytorum TaxID=1619310 RepID=A0ABQ2BTR3_9BACL|nr:hypothetical protein GCM10008018_14710 [Paenibacillus marchantiophytorum]
MKVYFKPRRNLTPAKQEPLETRIPPQNPHFAPIEAPKGSFKLPTPVKSPFFFTWNAAVTKRALCE